MNRSRHDPGGAPRPVLLVVDTGVDDALAIVVAHRHPGLQLVGVVAAAGNVPLPRAAANSRAVLDLLRCPAPLLRGAAVRSDGRDFSARVAHGPDGLAGLGPPQPLSADETAALPPLDAALLGRLARHAPALQVACLAPLTSLAGLPVGAVLASYARPGEANHAMDPDAADRLLAAGSLQHPDSDAALPDLPDQAPRPDAVAGLGLALLQHQRDRGTGLGDAAVVLALAGSAHPGTDLLGLLGLLTP